MRHCSKCTTWKSEENFTKNAKSKDGLNYWCKLCTQANSRRGYYKYKAKRTETIAKYRQSDKAKRMALQSYKKWKENNPKKYISHMALKQGIRFGFVTVGRCEICGSQEVDGHHEDYDRPYDVHWLCRAHHREIHRKEV